MKAKMWFDGACRGNPGGVSAGAAVIRLSESSEPLVIHGMVFRGTNNESEFKGLIVGLHEALKVGVRHLQIYGDSMLVVQQVKGEWRVKKAHLRPLHAEAITLLRNFDSWTITWVPREQNSEADLASNQAIDQPWRLTA